MFNLGTWYLSFLSTEYFWILPVCQAAYSLSTVNTSEPFCLSHELHPDLYAIVESNPLKSKCTLKA